MTEYCIRICTVAATLAGSGEGFGSIVDADIVYDRLGLPYLPARRVKGLLRESALEILEMFEQAKLCPDLTREVFYHTFGEQGDLAGANVKIRDLCLDGEEELKAWLPWLYAVCPSVMNPHKILDCFTEIRQQTSITEDGLAEQGSLRVNRVLKKGYVFRGKVIFSNPSPQGEKLLALACLNLRRMGSNRNRGLGEIDCSLRNTSDMAVDVLTEIGG